MNDECRRKAERAGISLKVEGKRQKQDLKT